MEVMEDFIEDSVEENRIGVSEDDLDVDVATTD